jgi:small subunit ribosomal protein S17
MSGDKLEERGSRKSREGIVVSDSMEKTVVVLVERRVRHPLYGKEIRRSKKYHVHDEENRAKKGDRVRFLETRPLSRTKRWRLSDIIQQA